MAAAANDDVVPGEQEGLTDASFEEQVTDLPTFFSSQRVSGRISRARLQALRSRVTSELEKVPQTDQEEHDRICRRTVPQLLQDGADLTQKEVSQILADGHRQARALGWQTATFTPKILTFGCFLVFVDWLLGRKDEAVQRAQRIANRYPHSLMARSNRLCLLWKSGDREEAMSDWRFIQEMKMSNPLAYQTILEEELGELGRDYTEMGPDYNAKAIEVLERVHHSHPDWHRYAFLLAKNLHRSINDRTRWLSHGREITASLIRAVTLLQGVLNAGVGNSVMQSAANAEIGDILHHCELNADEIHSLQEVLHRAKEADLVVEECFDTVMRTPEADPSDLVRAGKYYRHTDSLEKSRRALREAARRQQSAKAYHQLALTCTKMMKAEKRRQRDENRRQYERDRQQQRQQRGRGRGRGAGNGAHRGGTHYIRPLIVVQRSKGKFRPDLRMEKLERTMKALMYGSFQRGDMHVGEMLQNLIRALEVSNDENSEVSYDLGLAYRQLREYDEALKQFTMMLDLNCHPKDVAKAFEQCGLISLETDDLSEGKTLIYMAILWQARLVFEKQGTRAPVGPWRSLGALCSFLNLTENSGNNQQVTTEDVNEEELWLLRLLWMYADTLPLLQCLRKGFDSLRQNSEREQVTTPLSGLLLDIILRLLPSVTEELQRFKFADWKRRYIEAARTTLIQQDSKPISSSLYRNIARRLFRWVFEDAYPSNADPAAGAELADEAEAGGGAMTYHVTIISDPRDASVARYVRDLLRDLCGLTSMEDIGESDMLQAIDEAPLIVFICGSNETTPQYEECVTRAQSDNRRAVVALTLDPGTTLPESLRRLGVRNLPVARERGINAAEAYRLFCFLVNFRP